MEKCSETTEDMTQAILAFDTLYTTNHMKILKLLLPYLEQEHQKKLAVFIKWQELLFTLNFFKQYSASLYSSDFKRSKKFCPSISFVLAKRFEQSFKEYEPSLHEGRIFGKMRVDLSLFSQCRHHYGHYRRVSDGNGGGFSKSVA